jgi:CrcB protein
MHGPERRASLAVRGRRVLRDRWDVLLVISAGGVTGSLARWGAAQALPHRADRFPWATALVNVSGCLLIGVLLVLVLQVWPPSRYARPFLGTGVLGGYTTFSTAMLDVHGLLVAGRPGVALAYLGGSVLTGLLAVELGAALARALAVRRPGRRGAHDDGSDA